MHLLKEDSNVMCKVPFFPEWSRILIKWGSTPNIYLPEYFTFKSPLTLLWTRIFLTLTDKMEYFQDMVSLEKSILTRRRVWGIKHTFYGKTNQVVQILQILPSNQKNELTILLLSFKVGEKMSRGEEWKRMGWNPGNFFINLFPAALTVLTVYN